MEQSAEETPNPDFGARKAISPSGELQTPSENDLLVTRLVARIAELEERLYKKELEAPAIGYRTQGSGGGGGPSTFGNQQPQQQDQLLRTPVAAMMPVAPRLRDSFLATLRESWAKLELHAAGGGGGAAGPAAAPSLPPPPPGTATAAMPMRSLDAVATPPRSNTWSAGGAAAAAAAAVTLAAKTAGGGTVADADNEEPTFVEDLQAVSFNFGTHLVVDYSKPTRGSPVTPRRRRLRKRHGKGVGDADAGADGGSSSSGEEGGITREGDGNDSEDEDDDDGGSLSSVGSSGMGYDTSAEEQELERRRSSMAGSPRPWPKPSQGSVPLANQGRGGGGRRPPLPPAPPPAGGRAGSDGGGTVVMAAPLSSAHQQQSQQQQSPQTGGAAPSRASAWSGSVLSKLGLPWGRDRVSDSRYGGGNLARNASAGSLFHPFPTSRQSVMGSGSGSSAAAAAQAGASFSDRALEEQLAGGGGLGLVRGSGTGDGSGASGRYYRYVFDPADVQAEMEVTARVRRAAAEALMEANAKLAEAQAATAALQQQVEQAKQLEQELEALRAERSAAQAAKATLEDEMAAVRRQLEVMKETEGSLQAELESVRSQADIWRCSKGGEPEKLKQENVLLRSQLTNRLSELQSCRSRLSEGEAERQRLLREAEELRNKIQWLTKINLQLETAASQLNDSRRAAAEWQERFMRERNVRRRLHDHLQQLRANIRVVCRVRPVRAGQRDIVSYPLEGLLAVSPPDKRYQEFEFDHVFPPGTSQSAVFEEAVGPLVRSVAEGDSACVFAYGQTGSGKTYTMQGPSEDPGIYIRALRELFRIAAEESGAVTNAATAAVGSAAAAAAALARCAAATGGSGAASAAPGAGVTVLTVEAEVGGGGATELLATAATSLSRYSFKVSICDIYNEAVYDMLAPGTGEGGVPKPLEVAVAGPGELPPGYDRLPGRTWHLVFNVEGMEALLEQGARNRAALATGLGAPTSSSSSRSHSMLSVRLEVAEGAAGPTGTTTGIAEGEGIEGRTTVSTLHLVDLAGSERVDKGGDASGQPPKDAQSVSRSLSALGDVIQALQRRSTPGVLLRNSSLTAVLQDALCGNSKILLLCNVAPEAASARETVSALNFASRAAQVELGTLRPSGSSERLDRKSPLMSPVAYERQLQDSGTAGGGGGRSAGIANITAAPSSPLLHHPPLPIMNGTAAKVRAAAAAAAAAAMASPSGSGNSNEGGGSACGAAGLRSSQSLVGMNRVVVGGSSVGIGGGGGCGGGGGSSSGSSNNSSSGGGGVASRA